MDMKCKATHSGLLIYRHWPILCRITWNDLRAKYAGSLFGITWALLYPMVMLSVYAIVYILILHIQVKGLSTMEYTFYIFSGLVPLLATAEALTMGTVSVSTNITLLDNRFFPIDLCPAKTVMLSMVQFAVGLSIVLIGSAFLGKLSWSIVLVPVLCCCQLLSLVGLSWFLSLAHLVIKDLQFAIGPIMTMLMVVSPVAYTPEMVPAHFRMIVLLNPFAWYVVAYQKALILGEFPSAWDMTGIASSTAIFFLVGGYVFSRSKRWRSDFV